MKFNTSIQRKEIKNISKEPLYVVIETKHFQSYYYFLSILIVVTHIWFL